MRHLIIFILLFPPLKPFCQYKVDTSVKKEYLKILENLPQKFKDKTITEYKGGLSLLYSKRTDTINKEDFRQLFDSSKSYDIVPIRANADPIRTTPIDQELISRNQPFPMSCNCSLRDDSLTITSGIYLFSNFTITIKLYMNMTQAFFSEIDSEKISLRRTLKEQKTNHITIPAKVIFLNLDRVPHRNTKVLFGHTSITTNGYYSSLNVPRSKSDYIYKRVEFQFYFSCDLKSNVQQ